MLSSFNDALGTWECPQTDLVPVTWDMNATQANEGGRKALTFL